MTVSLRINTLASMSKLGRKSKTNLYGSATLVSSTIRDMNRTTSELSDIYGQLSSGKRINKASDDSEGLSIALSLNAKSKTINQGIKNVNDGISAVSMANKAISALIDITQKRQELAGIASNGTCTDKQREVLNTEFRALGEEYERIFKTTDFNEIDLLSGGLDNLSLQAGDETISVILKNAFTDLEKNGGEDYGFDLGNKNSYTVAQDDGYPMQIALADLNGDGFLDMVTTDYGTAEQCFTEEGYSNTVSVSLGNGDGTFQDAVLYELGAASRPNSISIADIDNDDKLDLVVQTAQDDQVYTLTGNGDGTFNNATTFDPNLSVLSAIGTGDINGDGNVDVISTGRKVGTSGYRVYVNLGDGEGKFTENLTGTVIESTAFDMEVADLNDDGNDDVITVNRSAKSVSVLMSNGTSTLSTAVTYREDDAVYDVTTGDLDGDSILDMVVATGNNVTVYQGAGDGSFTKIGTYEGGNTVTSVGLGDVNGDGSLDIVSTAGKDDEISIFFGNGDGTFEARKSYSSGDGPMSVAVGDLNNDGLADAVTANSNDSTASSYLSGTANLSVETQSRAIYSNDKLSEVLDGLSVASGSIGAIESRLEVAVSVMESSRDGYLSAESAIMDVDIAESTTNLLRKKITQDASTALFAQANILYDDVYELLLDFNPKD